MDTRQVPSGSSPAMVAGESHHEMAHEHFIEVLVNFQPVRLTERRLIGLAIKQAAIDQGVKIQEDFVLFELLTHDRRELIRDNETVEVRAGERFEAVPGDDNS